MFVIYINDIKHSAWENFFLAESELTKLRVTDSCMKLAIKNEKTTNMINGEYF